ncbi:MAG: hypothetical protein A3B99_04890 [Candidatus Yanofskybacteria bacterium RIFCSPHIGHO2_02_FULL_44_12b]|uniref:Uncharacterized protein n=2 Tax=Candidatus Yanofskyibacteriota TaxID=1752733 RepID=A0A1F8GL92_9BACT|nr:MAG: hypothetical protein UW79_C0003G0032 [Candidatus Yanofskybacteria bacterium GW2011_GWA2_44_9]OGN04390.1 MAG: hypothetical protein A2659_03620 [Candidatus Yanofskybacteria bacterium RIFCSPHIGHO2_01_FULL_44_24]OGN16187.1 MAG: hypothetical protein A3B99_04890 [Candidatus Yanofskybacteria bacterium RIFCSPHIGHO2_02_FULL_44_12b]OGN25780.1 MAG: hypothetical protein A2925_01160 [Candidatus Yanofskybacteria bacterium RIFCSPLOWO2_01_FULL_44_22]
MTELKEPQTKNPESTKHFSAVDGVISENMTIKDKEEIRDFFIERFEKQDIEDIKGGEIELSPEQASLVDKANRTTNEFLTRIGVDPKIDIGPKNIHVLNEETFDMLVKKSNIDPWASVNPKRCAAFAHTPNQGIFIREKKAQDDIAFLHLVIHEMLHFKGYITLQPAVVGNEELLTERRMGLRMRQIERVKKTKPDGSAEKFNQPGQLYFSGLDEAIIEKSALHIVRNYDLISKPELRDELEKSELLRKAMMARLEYNFKERGDKMSDEATNELTKIYFHLDLQSVILPEAGRLWDEYEKSGRDPSFLENAISFYCDYQGERHLSGYVEEKFKLDNLTVKIYSKNPGRFSSLQEVAVIFAQAVFTGKVLPLARLIDETFGKGSFRRLGEGKDITAEEDT